MTTNRLTDAAIEAIERRHFDAGDGLCDVCWMNIDDKGYYPCETAALLADRRELVRQVRTLREALMGEQVVEAVALLEEALVALNLVHEAGVRGDAVWPGGTQDAVLRLLANPIAQAILAARRAK